MSLSPRFILVDYERIPRMQVTFSSNPLGATLHSHVDVCSIRRAPEPSVSSSSRSVSAFLEKRDSDIRVSDTLPDIQVGRRVSETDVLRTFAESELWSPRWSQYLVQYFDQSTADRLRDEPSGLWSQADRDQAIYAIKQLRGPILGPLLSLSPEWHEAQLATDEVAELRTIRFDPFRALSPDYRVGGLVSAMDSGRDTPGDGFSSGYRSMRDRFNPDQMRGRSCLAAKSKDGPYVIFEGLTRLCCLLSRTRKGIVTPSPIHVCVGVTLEPDRWRFSSV
jgi:hypothetical protein